MSPRFWERLGYRPVICPFPAGAPSDGVIHSQVFIRLSFADRLRLMLLGRLQVNQDLLTDFAVPPGARILSQVGHMVLHPHCSWPGKDGT